MNDVRISTRRSLFIALSLLLLFAAPAVPQTRPSAPPPGFIPIWSKSVTPLIALAISPQGAYTGMLTQSGKLALWNGDNGKPVWSQMDTTDRDLAVSDGMGYVLACDKMNPLNTTIKLYRAKIPSTRGDDAKPSPPTDLAAPILAGKDTLDSAVWAMGVSLDGSYAACGTGNRQVTLIDLRPDPRFSSHPIDGICNDLEFAGNNEYIALGLWNQSGVETMDMAGHIRWSYPAADNCRYDVSISPDSHRVLAIAYRNHKRSNPVLILLDDTGAVRWSHDVDEGAVNGHADDPVAKLTPSSDAVYVSYSQTVKHGRELVPEHSLVALSPVGNVKLWRKPGGPFFNPRLLCVTSDGSGVIVYDGINTLYRLDSNGNRVARDKLPGGLVYYAISHNRKRLVIYTDDGEISMLGIG